MDIKSTTKLLGWNSKYICSFRGILNICEIVLSYVCVQLLRDTCRPAYSSSTGGFVGSAHETYFYLCSFTCMIITSILLFSFVISQVSCIMMERTILCVLFWSICCLFSFLTSIILFFYVNGSNSIEMFGYSHKVAAAILGCINSGFFLINAVKSYKSCRRSVERTIIFKSLSHLLHIFHA
ncbi:MARVEL domain-containing protein [Caerostris darwini]|uniref:MARVEL domain-containing protein n=1 Tax=Caerostris darwini TaxID=1538125 RepID=A0AAV4UXZ1_9ARAC|nr:MARVEL domain-containing protein [Caerostris darwini]